MLAKNHKNNLILLYKNKFNNFSWKKTFLVILIAAFVFFVVTILYYYVTYSKDKIILPTQRFEFAKQNPSKFNDEELKGVELAKYNYIELNKIPSYCKEAVVAVEDKNYWNNNGIDLKGLARGVLGILTRIDFGGSTISMQLVKISQDKFYNRNLFNKIQEVVWAYRLNQSYTKEEILEKYLNNAYFGDFNYGAAAASLSYFNKDISELDISECAYLMGILQLPSYYSPTIGNIEAGKKRQQIVLQLMQANQ